MPEKPSWAELPFDLQEQFYLLTEAAAESLAKRIQSVESELAESWPRVKFAVKAIRDSRTKEMTIASVDGSRSPMPARRLGGDFAVYSVGMLKLEGKKVVENRFAAGRVDDVRAQRVDLANLLSAKALAAEREVVVSALDGADLVLLDGSFYGYIGEVFSVLREARLGDSKVLGEWAEAVQATLGFTEKLVSSGKCIGVVKRSRTRAISGWLSTKSGKPSLLGLIDKHILDRMLPAESIFDYSSLLAGEMVLPYSVLGYNLATGREVEPTIDAYDRARKFTADRFTKAFQVPFGFHVEVGALKRIQARPYRDASPCELEIPDSVSGRLVDDFVSPQNFSEATGLPFAIDMIDEYVGIPRAFTTDFVHEVEARVNSLTPSNLKATRGFFTGLNPQKEGVE